jgi:hypothetical protein
MSYFDFFEIAAQPIIDDVITDGFREFLQVYIDFRAFKPSAVQNFLNLCGNREIIPYNPEQWQINDIIGDMMFYEKWIKYNELTDKKSVKDHKFDEKLLMKYEFKESKHVREIKDSITFDQFLLLLNNEYKYYFYNFCYNPKTKLIKQREHVFKLELYKQKQYYELVQQKYNQTKCKKPAYN